ncbi:hypothetical protein FRC08_004771 [Ceratobasidium sp. 394]|nr:hypothetical protein FRC08_004771 [Ceratobasidium sp. 394]KAG9096830.1 hypothetical protein FS749_007636 [Ceratobasidium sp. UAMH 11750]
MSLPARPRALMPARWPLLAHRSFGHRLTCAPARHRSCVLAPSLSSYTPSLRSVTHGQTRRPPPPPTISAARTDVSLSAPLTTAGSAQRQQLAARWLGRSRPELGPPRLKGSLFDHILNKLQMELQKSRETGAELHSLTSAMNDIHDTMSDAVAHVDKIRALERLVKEHEAIKSEVGSMCEMHTHARSPLPLQLQIEEGEGDLGQHGGTMLARRRRSEDEYTPALPACLPP